MSNCQVFETQGIANNIAWINNTFTGINIPGYTLLMNYINHVNFTFIDNKFINAKWYSSRSSITVAHATTTIKCPRTPFTKINI